MTSLVRWISAAALLLACACTSSSAPQKHARLPNTSFDVTFEGIILHADLQAEPQYHGPGFRRAFLVEPGPFTSMRHVAELVLPPDVDVAALRDATGGLPECNALRCKIRIQGWQMRILSKEDRDAIAAHLPLPPAPAPMKVEETFRDFVPHLRDDPAIAGGSLATALLTDGLPNAPMAGYFEVSDRGRLFACAFASDGNRPNGGLFVKGVAGAAHAHGMGGGGTAKASGPTVDVGEPHPRPFARQVHWSDSNITEPVLQIRSVFSGRWVDVPFRDMHPLTLFVHNRPRGKVTPTSTHFALYEKFLRSAHLPAIEPAVVETKECTASALVYVPGCADSGWP